MFHGQRNSVSVNDHAVHSTYFIANNILLLFELFMTNTNNGERLKNCNFNAVIKGSIILFFFINSVFSVLQSLLSLWLFWWCRVHRRAQAIFVIVILLMYSWIFHAQIAWQHYLLYLVRGRTTCISAVGVVLTSQGLDLTLFYIGHIAPWRHEGMDHLGPSLSVWLSVCQGNRLLT